MFTAFGFKSPSIERTTRSSVEASSGISDSQAKTMRGRVIDRDPANPALAQALAPVRERSWKTINQSRLLIISVANKSRRGKIVLPTTQDVQDVGLNDLCSEMNGRYVIALGNQRRKGGNRTREILEAAEDQAQKHNQRLLFTMEPETRNADIPDPSLANETPFTGGIPPRQPTSCQNVRYKSELSVKSSLTVVVFSIEATRWLWGTFLQMFGKGKPPVKRQAKSEYPERFHAKRAIVANPVPPIRGLGRIESPNHNSQKISAIKQFFKAEKRARSAAAFQPQVPKKQGKIEERTGKIFSPVLIVVAPAKQNNANCPNLGIFYDRPLGDLSA
ncbi:hypothetical protein R3P38DRAFT_2769876 [Favolaschia claudopus]|uniref:Uncharacterized protein n=1 Tax=Favolaschia claudopus TaxID=2862362 RepID=A0AAW0CKT9_9AGAR